MVPTHSYLNRILVAILVIVTISTFVHARKTNTKVKEDFYNIEDNAQF